MLSKFTAVEYEMSPAMAEALIKASKNHEKLRNDPVKRQAYLVDLVNEQFGIRGYCVKVIY